PEADSVLCSLPLTLSLIAGMGLDQNNIHMLTPSPCRLPLESSGVGRGDRAFAFEQRGLAFGSPAIAGERSVLLHHAMAWNHHGHRVGSAGSGHGAHGAGTSHGYSDLGVIAGLAARDVAKRIPHELLKGSPLNVERDLGGIEATTQQSAYLVRQRGQLMVVADQLGGTQLPPQFRLNLPLTLPQ